MTTEIPEQLKKPEFRFVLLEKDTKRPFESKWTTENNYPFNDPKLLKHLQEVGSYGVMGGYGGMVILDIDNKDFVGEIVKLLPETFTVQTGGGGLHHYFTTGTPEKIILDKGNVHIGEIQGPGAQCVGPGSIHPKTKKPYVVINDIPVARLEESVIKYIKDNFTQATVFKVEAPEWNQYRKSMVGDKISISELIDLSTLKKYGAEEYYGVHPIHGSTTGQNFFVNPTRNMWHCFRHNSGGDALSWLAIKEGICDCADFSPGGKKIKGADFIATLKVAKEKHNVEIDEFTKTISNKDLIDYDITLQQLDQADIGELELVNSEDVKHLKVKNAEWLVEGLLVCDGINYLAGKSGSFKTLSALHMALCISEGKPVFGTYPVKKRKVWYINEENTWSIFKPMVEGCRKGLQTEGSKNLIFSTYQNLSLDIQNVEARAKLEKVISEKKIEVLVLDSLKRFFTFEENDADKVNRFYQIVVKPLVKKYNLTVIMLLHTKKENAQFKFKSDKKDMIRGSSDFVNIADNVLYFERSVKNLMYDLHQIKCRVAEEFKTKTIKITADKIAGMSFEEIITDGQSQDVLANACAMEIIDYCVKEDCDILQVSRVKGLLEARYKRTAIYTALHQLLVQGALQKTAGKGKYKVNKTNNIFVEIAADEAKEELGKDDSKEDSKDDKSKRIRPEKDSTLS